MCTAGPCNYEACGLSSNEVPEQVPRSCVKCGNEDVVEVRGRNGYCEACFLGMTSHKFRATLGKSKIIRKGDSVLVAYSGKPNSTMLLHLIKSGNEQSVHKKLIFQTKLLYVDDGAAKGLTVEERSSNLREIQNRTRDSGLESYAVSLRRSFDEGTPILPLDEYRASQESVEELFHGLADDTGRDELLRRLRRKVFLSAAKALGCGKVFLADTSTDLAVKTLSDVSTGRGSQLAAELAFCDTRSPDAMFLRPMREFGREDIEFYTSHYSLKPVFKCQRTFPSSIRSIASVFVDGLSSEFGGTVSTVYRTSEKLGEGPVGSRNEERCILCDSAVLCSDTTSLTAVEATAFSRFVSSRGSTARASMERIQPSVDESCQSSPCVRSKSLCYGCASIFSRPNARIPSESMPGFIRDALEKERLEDMRQQIADFLL